MTFDTDNAARRGERKGRPTRPWSPSTTTTCPSDVDVEFGQSSYTVAEGGTVTVKVTLSEDPERDRHHPHHQGRPGRGVELGLLRCAGTNVTFNAGDTEKSFTFSATLPTAWTTTGSR